VVVGILIDKLEFALLDVFYILHILHASFYPTSPPALLISLANGPERFYTRSIFRVRYVHYVFSALYSVIRVSVLVHAFSYTLHTRTMYIQRYLEQYFYPSVAGLSRYL